MNNIQAKTDFAQLQTNPSTTIQHTRSLVTVGCRAGLERGERVEGGSGELEPPRPFKLMDWSRMVRKGVMAASLSQLLQTGESRIQRKKVKSSFVRKQWRTSWKKTT